MKRIWRYRYTAMCAFFTACFIVNDTTIVLRHRVDLNQHWPGWMVLMFGALTAMSLYIERHPN